MAKNKPDVNVDTSGSIKDSKGRFKKGHSGNPGGITKEKKEIVDLCKSMSEDVVRILFAIAQDKDKNPMSRILAGNSILDRAWGKPAQSKEEGGSEQYIPPQMIINMSKEDYEEYLKEQEQDGR